jgi:penicillin-binding protein 2
MNQYSTRQFIIGGIIVLVFFIYIIRLFYIQVIDKSYRNSAENNSQRNVVQYPSRGLIYDRKGRLLVCNEAAYDLMLNPQELRAFDTSEFCNILGISKDQVIDGIQKAKNFSHYKSSPFIYQVSDLTYALFQESMYKFPGFYAQPRTLRRYTGKIAAHLFGYVGEVDSSVIKKDSYYQIGDYIGMSGMEKSYEKVLRGKKGVTKYLVDVHNRVKGSFQNGMFDTASVIGKNIVSTIDAGLQEYGEKLMANCRGSIVAIEPSTGEVLALVSSPTYDPQLLVGRLRSKNYGELKQDNRLPLFNRAIMPKYPPGSPFKLLNAMIGLKEGVVTQESQFSCYLGYTAGPIHVKCHPHPTPLDMPHGIQYSCNAYFDNVFRRIIENPSYTRQSEAFDAWRNYILTFGFGKKLNSDFTNELSGNIPTSKYYDKIYGRNGWKSLTVISLAIGQGELGVTPLHLANLAATIANRGFYFIPHTVRKIEGLDTIESRFTNKHFTAFDSTYFNVVVHGMELAVNGPNGGTANGAEVPGIIVCGKTGTAQNAGVEDHSIFIAFAPKDNPKIALSVYVENGGFGANFAVPVASLLIEKYLKDTVNRAWLEDYVKSYKINYVDKK